MPQAQQNEPDQAAIDAVNLSRLIAAGATKSSATELLGDVCEKASLQGMHVKAAKKAIQVRDSGKSAEFIAETERTIYYLKLLGKPVDKSQLEMFEGAPESAPEDEKAGEEGLSAGRLGHEENQNPYDLGSPKGQAWLKRFREGAAERQIVLSMAPDEEAEDDEGE